MEYQAFSVFTVKSGLCGQGREMEECGTGIQQYLLPRIISDLSTSLAMATSVFPQSKLRLAAESFDKNVNLKNLLLVSHYRKNKSMILNTVDNALRDLVSAYLFSLMLSGP